MTDTKKRYVAYSDLGVNGASGSFVDPDDFGGEESDNFKYMLDHRTIIPLGDPDAAIVMGSSGAVAAADEKDAAHQAEIDELKARIAELEEAASKSAAQVQTSTSSASSARPVQTSSSPGTSSSPSTSNPSGTKAGG